MKCIEDLDKIAEIFKALSHPTRLQIAIGLMTKNNCNVSTMVKKLCLAQPKVSQHLTILKSAGVIEGYRNGNQICYKLTNEKVKKIIKSALQGGNK